MNEHYLQLIWSQKRLPFHRIKTTDGRAIEIREVGDWNFNSGPDFFNGTILLDGVTLVGNIEIHVKSSDWVLHKHQFDAAYNNVILHVVYEDDMRIELNGLPIPTIALKEHIDWKHFTASTKKAKTTQNVSLLPCAYFLAEVPAPIVWDELARCSWSRLNRKATINSSNNQVGNYKEVLFTFLARSFGMKTNRLAFEELANRLPITKVLQATSKQKVALCLGTAGFLEPTSAMNHDLVHEWNYQKKRLDIHEANRLIWKYKGCRPAGYPPIRILQFAHFIDAIPWEPDFWKLPIKQISTTLFTYLLTPIQNTWFPAWKEQQFTMSKQTATILLINGVVPFLFWLNRIHRDASYAEKAIELLELLPPEKHSLIDPWIQLGILPRSAFDTQGILELSQTKCVSKQCLNCKIGRYGLTENEYL